jgi:hypothetical protein
VLLEKGTVRRGLVDVDFFDVHTMRLQKTSGVPARRSRRLPIEGHAAHGPIVT